MAEVLARLGRRIDVSQPAGTLSAEDRATIEHVMRVITPREREVLRLRFAEDLTQAEIGERVGVSQMQVSRIIRQSIARLRAYAAVADEGVLAELGIAA